MLGPGASLISWEKPLAKYKERCMCLASTTAAPSIAGRCYNGRIVPVMGYVAQFYPPPPLIKRLEMTSRNRVIHTPGSTLSIAEKIYQNRL